MSVRIRLITCLVAVFGFSGIVSAQRSYDHWTLEAMAAQARVVLRGFVSEVSKLDMEPKPGQPAKVRITLTVRVQERLKGSSDSWMTLDRVTLASDNRYDLWVKDKASLLFFTFSEDDPRPFAGSDLGPGLELPPGQSWIAVHLDQPGPAEVTLDPFAAFGSLCADLSVITAGKDKIDAVRKFEKAHPGSVKVCRIHVPLAMTKSIGYTSGTQNIVFPITPELESLAHKMVSSPELVLPKDHLATDIATVRAAGTKALGIFKS